MRALLKANGLYTVCEGARCPNLGECWENRTATFMILGDTCTRGCRFCAVKAGSPDMPDADEPLAVADAVRRLGLKYVVVTSVTRDDLPDQGAWQFARTVRAIKEVNSGVPVEVLIPDLSADEDLIRSIVEAEPAVVGHNIETVRRLSLAVRSGADYDRSLEVLRTVRRLSSDVFVKSGLMAGMGETDEEIVMTLQDLKEAGCDIVTIGQYLAPTKCGRHINVERFVPPEVFEKYREEGLKRGLKYVLAGPLVRSSYLAEKGFHCCQSARGALVG
jgi:lipoic acid synthetase